MDGDILECKRTKSGDRLASNRSVLVSAELQSTTATRRSFVINNPAAFSIKGSHHAAFMAYFTETVAVSIKCAIAGDYF